MFVVFNLVPPLLEEKWDLPMQSLWEGEGEGRSTGQGRGIPHTKLQALYVKQHAGSDVCLSIYRLILN